MRTRLAAQQEPKVYRGLIQGMAKIASETGILGLYAGLWPTLVGIVPLMALQYSFYEELKNVWHAINTQSLLASSLSSVPTAAKSSTALPPIESDSVNFAAGFVSGCGAKLVTMPLDVIKKRYAYLYL